MPSPSAADLATRIEARARAGKVVRLSPETGLMVAVALRTHAAQPCRGDVARALCTARCQQPCMTCVGVANVISRLYAGEEGPFDDGSGASSARLSPAGRALKIVSSR
jgi:hypothetical protein